MQGFLERIAQFSMADASWPVLLGLLLSGFVLLAKGATWLVDGGARLARRMGMSTLVVGLTVVAWGTSMRGMTRACGPVATVSAQRANHPEGASSSGSHPGVP